MRIIIALHVNQHRLIEKFSGHFASLKYDVLVRSSQVTIKKEVRRDPLGLTVLVVDTAFLSLAEEPQIIDIWGGPIVGVYYNWMQKAAMERMGLVVTTPDSLISTVAQTLARPRPPQKPRIVACFGIRELGRDQYFRILSKVATHKLVRCVNAKQALDVVVSSPSSVRLLVIGYHARLIVSKAYRAGYKGEVVAICENPLKEQAMLDCGLTLTEPQDFERRVAQFLKR